MDQNSHPDISFLLNATSMIAQPCFHLKTYHIQNLKKGFFSKPFQTFQVFLEVETTKPGLSGRAGTYLLQKYIGITLIGITISR